MSFSQQVKREIVGTEIDIPCCVAAACYGVACFGKYFDGRGIVLHTEQEYIAQWACDMFLKAGVSGTVHRRSKTAGSYEFAVKDPFEVEKMLAMFSHTGDETAIRIRRENFNCGRCFSTFVAAAFLCGGVVINPEKGYLLEFVSPRYSLMRDFEALLVENGFAPRLTNRKGYNVLYFKASEQIEDMLTLMGAPQSSLEIMNLKVYKDFRNKANRITNCETANIDKIVASNRRILAAIDYLEQAGAMQLLPQQLQRAAVLRREHPDLSLADLVLLSEEKVSKSGLSHRYRKICEKADALRAQEER